MGFSRYSGIQEREDRFCIHYRKVNMVLKARQCPFTRVNDILTVLWYAILHQV
jgi:hypothetical protein